MPVIPRKRPNPRAADDEMLRRDRQIVERMAEEGPMPLDYMERNMHWYAAQAVRHETIASELPDPKRFRNKKQQHEAARKIAHHESMAIKFRALNQAAAENTAHYAHARIQSITAGNNARGNRPLTIILRGDDANL